jgi:hypothetical protein
VLDQRSTDSSREICARFPKVAVIENPSHEYNETSRSRLLVEAARTRFGTDNVLIGLDADEIPSGNSIESGAWQRLRALSPGTVICFEKPEMLPHPARCVRSAYWFPLGVVDDGSTYDGRLIHSNRVPLRQEAPRYYAADVCALHFARLRPIEFAVRQAYYCMVENVNRSKSQRVRNCYYSPHAFLGFGKGLAEPCPPQWFGWFDQRGLDLWSYRTERFNSFHRRALSLFAKHGERRFHWDDIWWDNWEEARLYFLAKGEADLPPLPLRGPSPAVRLAIRQLVRTYLGASRLRQSLWHRCGQDSSPKLYV